MTNNAPFDDTKKCEIKDAEYDENLVCDNLNLARSVARKYLCSGIEYDDLQSMAFIGLVRAAKKYDKSIGCAFSSFAVVCIENEIKRTFMKKRICAESLETVIYGDVVLSDTIGEETDCFREIEIKDAIKCAMKKLSERERFVINSLYFRDPPLTLKETGKLLNISTTMVGKISKQALEKIKKYVV